MPVKKKGRKPRNPKTKPYFPHASGYWAAKINGRTRYLARWDTPLDQVDRTYEEQVHQEAKAASDTADQASGGQPLVSDAITVKDVANLFINGRAVDAENGDLAWVTWRNYRKELKWFTTKIGARPVATLRPTDFNALNNDLKAEYGYKDHERRIATLKMALRWCYENGYIEQLPRYGTQFKTPGRREYRRERAKKADKLFEAAQLRKLIGAADARMKAMILLGINCAYLQSDIAALPIRFEGDPKQKIDLGADPFIRFDRPKTGERRKATLWPETVTALRAVIGNRRKGHIFLTRRGQPVVHAHRKTDSEGRVLNVAHCDAVAKPFRELCKACGCHVSGRGFSALRSTFETRAWQISQLQAGDVAAIHWIMGHSLGGPEISKMADVYVQDIDLATLRRVTDGIRDWLFQSGK